VALGQVFLPVVLFPPVSIIPPMLHIQSCIVGGLDSGGQFAAAVRVFCLSVPYLNTKVRNEQRNGMKGQGIKVRKKSFPLEIEWVISAT
jgi:hypothetical protein